MKIVLICIGGISSSILAKRLQKYADENGYPDTFEATTYFMASQSGDTYDVYMIAPQLANSLKDFTEYLQKSGKNILFISEEEYANLDVTSTYAGINAFRKGQPDNNESFIPLKTFSPVIWYILAIVVLNCLFTLIAGKKDVNLGTYHMFMTLFILLIGSRDLASRAGKDSIVHIIYMTVIYLTLLPFSTKAIVDVLGETMGSWIVYDSLDNRLLILVSTVAFVLYIIYLYWHQYWKSKLKLRLYFARDMVITSSYFILLLLVSLLIKQYV